MKMLKKMRIVIALILLSAMCLSGCSWFGSVDYKPYSVALAANEMEVTYSDSKDEDYLAFMAKFYAFSALLSDELYDEFGEESDNICFSPISVYMALAMAAECANGETRAEILDALGMTYEEVSEFTRVLYAFCNEIFTYENVLGNEKSSGSKELTNSIWLDKSVSLNMDTANALADNYNADVFSVPFSNGEAKKALESYIEDKTHGLIDGKLDMDPMTVVTILNTLYVKDVWNDLGKELSKTSEKYDFKNSNGSEKSTYLLRSYYEGGKAYEGEDYYTFYAVTENGLKLHFILPKDGVSVSDIFDEDTISTVLSLKDYGGIDHANSQIHNTRVLFPEFEADFDNDISGVLKNELGIEKLFTENECDLSFISPYESIWCDSVVHRTKLTVDEMGIEGAAITAMMLAGSADPGNYERVYHDFVIDRAFGFVLTDEYGAALFSGVVNYIQ